MKKLILLITLLGLALLSPASARMNIATITGGGAPAAGGCPDWGTYLLAWDGEYGANVGGDGTTTDECCLDSGNEIIGGVNTAGVFGTDNGDVIWTSNADEDKLLWSVDHGDIAFDDANGVTIWAEYRISSMSAEHMVVEFYGDTNDYAIHKLEDTDDEPDFLFAHDGTYKTVHAGDTITDDGSTWNTSAVSWKINEAGNDSACSYDKTNWGEFDNDFADWDAVEVNIQLGSHWKAGGTSTLDIKRMVVISGYKAACPW